jgi:hypothetical protein
MAHSVIITTPIPTWDETVERLGLSSADQKFVAGLFAEEGMKRSTMVAFKPRSASGSALVHRSKNGSGRVRKSESRARKTA